MKAEWSVRFYGDWRSYLTTLRKGGIVGFDEGTRAKERGEDLIGSRSMGGDEDEPTSAHIVVKDAEEMADILAVLRADKDGGYGYGVGFWAETAEARVWVGLGSTGYYGEMVNAHEIRVDSAKLAGKLRDAMRAACLTLETALAPEEPS